MTALWKWSSVRMQIAVLLSIGMVIHALLRGVFGMAVVCIVPAINGTIILKNDWQVDWKLREISAMHMFFYAGTFMSAFAAHYFTLKLGAKRIITLGILVGCMATALIPAMISFSKDYIFTSMLRFITGLAQGFFIPCTSLLISKWFGQNERSTAMAVATVGNQIGLAIGMFATAELCEVSFMYGWPLAFIIYGLLGLFFLPLWIFTAADHPKQSDKITAVELAHIRDNTLSMAVPKSTPYKKLLFSPVVISICLCSFSQAFVMAAMTSYLPEFHRSALTLDLKENALWSSIPFVVQIVTKILFGVTADILKHRYNPSRVTKAFNSLASFGCAICLLLIGFAERTIIKLILLSTGMAFTSGYVPGFYTSIVSIAPTYTAAISAYSQGYAQVGSLIAPIIVGFMTSESSVGEWTGVFETLSWILGFSGLTFLIFGSSQEQPWAFYDPDAPDTSHRGTYNDSSRVDIKGFNTQTLTLIEENSNESAQ